MDTLSLPALSAEPGPHEAQRLRALIRQGLLGGTSRGQALGFLQCNLAILPQQHAEDFWTYCQRNARACPVLEVTQPGQTEPQKLAPGADLRTDCARYAVWRDGQRQADCQDINALWRADLVSFLIGSGITFDWNGKRVGMCDAGPEMTFHFGQLIAHLAKTRNVRAGSIIGSGTVSNKAIATDGRKDWPKGYSCIAEKRAIETILDGKATTDFMQFGDTVRIEMKEKDGHSVFGAIDQKVAPLRA